MIHRRGVCFNGSINNFMKTPDDVGNIGVIPILLQALVNNVNGVIVGPKLIDPFDVEAGFEFLEDLPTHHLKALTGLIVFR